MDIYLPYTSPDEDTENAQNEENKAKQLSEENYEHFEDSAFENEQTDNVPELKDNDPLFEIYKKHARRRSSVKKTRSRQASELNAEQISCNLEIFYL
jgi:hypothetical protein